MASCTEPAKAPASFWWCGSKQGYSDSNIVNIGNGHRGLAHQLKPGYPSERSTDAHLRGTAAPFVKVNAVVRCVLLCAAALILSSCASDTHLSFLNPQGPVASIQRTHFLEMVALLAIFVALPIFVLLPWFAWRYRYGAKSSRYTPKWAFSRTLEVAAWSGPAVIVALLAVLVWRSTHALDPYKPLASEMPALRVQVIGYDWKWLFIYPDQGVASIGVLPLPAGQPVAMQLTSATVMQSLQIPALGSQIYAMGGMVTQLHLQADKPGRFMGENTMYNGDGFHQQRFTAVAMTPDAFNDWVKQIQAHGVPLDASTLKLISEPTTRAQLAAALGQSQASDGGIYFNHATSDVFSSVVRATMDGTVADLQTMGHAATSTAVHVVGNATPPSAEQKP
ncbi:Cytochrome O ubiquinol oxidase subunit II [Caballeronia sordidicola]|uniref:Cytochrome O ubiquinol oxidase subunit II n=1 Tax=Caballeronia sordidicola TaxID=196367 RepID=A0A226X0W6_CABSO|nr:Cytochrome O ubiquinol oxidase subunit II [Caballeronia sordidicola]